VTAVVADIQPDLPFRLPSSRVVIHDGRGYFVRTQVKGIIQLLSGETLRLLTYTRKWGLGVKQPQKRSSLSPKQIAWLSSMTGWSDLTDERLDHGELELLRVPLQEITAAWPRIAWYRKHPNQVVIRASGQAWHLDFVDYTPKDQFTGLLVIKRFELLLDQWRATLPVA
jgi:hypothetical protein